MLAQSELKGIRSGISPEGIQMVRIHYSADPSKDPDTPEGAAWLKTELQGYQGETDPRWRKEMMIDFEAHGGQLLFPYLLEYQNQIFVQPYEVQGLRLIAGLDYGTRNPSAFEVLAQDSDDNIQAIWEYYEPPKKHDESDGAFRARKGYRALAKGIKSCPYYHDNLKIVADPSLWNKTQEARDAKGLMSIAELMAEADEQGEQGITLTPGQPGRDFACYEQLNSNLWQDPASPSFTIFQCCSWLWWELQRLRFADFSGATQINQNLKEKIVDKDNHAFDSIKYALMDIFNTEALFPGL